MLALAGDLPLAGAVDLGADVDVWAKGRNGSRSRSTATPPACPACRRARRSWSAPTRPCRPRRVVEPARAVAIQSLVLAGAGVRLEGEPRYDFADRLARRRAAPRHSRPCPTPARWSASPSPVRPTCAPGSPARVELPAITLDGTVDRLAVAGQSFDRVALAGEVKARSKPPPARPASAAARGEAGSGAGHRLPARRRSADAHRPDAERAGDPARRRRRGGAERPAGARPAGGRGARPRRPARPGPGRSSAAAPSSICGSPPRRTARTPPSSSTRPASAVISAVCAAPP